VDGVRIILATVAQTLREAGADVDPPTTIATAAIAVRNPLAGKGRVDDFAELEALGREAAALLVERALGVLASVGLTPADVRGYGKGAIVGIDGDREHTAAVLHPRFGAPVRAAMAGVRTSSRAPRRWRDRARPSRCPSGTRTTAGSSTTWTRWTSRSRTRRARTRSSSPSR
jgi:hypothetical protein